MSRSSRLLLALILFSASLLLAALFLAALPTLVRALPGRYAYYLPERLQAWRHVEHPDLLPTPVAGLTTAPTIPPTTTPAQPTANADPTTTAAPTASVTPTPSFTRPLTHTLAGLRYEPQGWNNCGPTTLAMALSYWAVSDTQNEVATALKPDPEDKNVSPHEMADYARDIGLEATLRVGGDLELLRRLVASGFPVIVETWYVRDAEDQLGHYRLIIGYNDETQQFLTYDSLHGPDLPIGYQELDELWRVFNRLYLVIHEPEQAQEVAALLGQDWDREAAVTEALETARQEALDPPTSCVAYADCADAEAFAWFNIGTNLVSMGQYEEAAAAFDRARMLGLPWRMLWYQFGPYRAYYATERYEDVIILTDATLAVAGNLEESFYWRARARLAQGDTEGARADLEATLRYHEEWAPALELLQQLEE